MRAPVKPEDLTDEMIRELRRDRLISAATYFTAMTGQWTQACAARQRICDAINARAGKDVDRG